MHTGKDRIHVSNPLDHLRRCSLAVDLGSARTRVHVKGTGLVVDEPSAVAVNTYSGALMAVGTAAERMDGRTPKHIRVVRPICNGTVVDVEMAQRMLRTLVGPSLRRARLKRGSMMRAAVTVPQDADPLARRAAVETMTGVGTRKVELVDTPTAAGLGCGLPVEQPEATMILVCGATMTQIAVLSLGAVVSSATVPLGGETINNAIVQHLRTHHEVVLPNHAVRSLQLTLTDAASKTPEVSGRDVVTGLARTVRINPEDVRAAVQAPLTVLLDSIRAVLHRCPPDLVADLAMSGMVLTGGSALLPGLDERLRENTGMLVHVPQNPGLSAINGLATLVEGEFEPLPTPSL